jgi:hypothetical protein
MAAMPSALRHRNASTPLHSAIRGAIRTRAVAGAVRKSFPLLDARKEFLGCWCVVPEGASRVVPRRRIQLAPRALSEDTTKVAASVSRFFFF